MFPHTYSCCFLCLAVSTSSLSSPASPVLNYLCLGKAIISSRKISLKALAEMGGNSLLYPLTLCLGLTYHVLF